MYEEACVIQNDMTHRKLQHLWEMYPTKYAPSKLLPGETEEDIDISKLPKYFYVNTKTGNSQWSIPYYTTSFPTIDIEATAFEKCIMNRDIIEKW